MSIRPVTPLLLLLLWFSFVRAKEFDEYTLKSAFVERFTRFVTWPDSLHKSDTVLVGVVGGKGTSFKALKGFFKTVPIQEKEVLVLNVVSQSGMKRFHILFVEDDTQFDIATIRNMASHAILTIGNHSDMAEKGLMISFYLDGSKLKFKVNTDELRGAGFKVSSFLLKMATIVETESGDNK